ncbi:MAG: M23 family metallopeptidase [Chloroflexota bacterium]
MDENKPNRTKRRWVTVVLLLLGLLLAGWYWAAGIVPFVLQPDDPRNQAFFTWRDGEPATREALVTVQRDSCPGAPFILPSDGFVGLFYADPRAPYTPRNPHQGIDIFSPGEPGVTPVYAAYDGYVTRESHWRSSLILRIPDDPLQPGRQIWLYHTHMADQTGSSFIIDAIPPGTRDLFVEQGTFLGYTGDYNGESARPVWVHLHFSIVQDDGRGNYLNELDFNNTIDPSPYLGMRLHYACAGIPVTCAADSACPED